MEMIKALLVCCLALMMTVMRSSAQTPVSFLPVLFVSPKPDRPAPDSAILYGATVCDGKLYNNKTLLARVNLPHGWNPALGLIAKLEVCSSTDCSKVYCSNYASGKFTGRHYCNFTYTADMEDVFLRVTAGPSPNLDWTVAVEFVDKKTWVPPKRLVMPGRIYDYPEPRAKNIGNGNIVNLMQLVKTASEQTVKTMEYREFYFRFCPDRGTGNRYDITIAVTGIDSQSAMATYVCLPNELPCTVISSTHYDPRGTGINTITLTTGSSLLTEIHVLVVGWGDGEQTNTFTLGATVTKLGP